MNRAAINSLLRSMIGASLAMGGAVSLGTGCQKKESETPDAEVVGCPRDDSRDAKTALALQPGKSVTGYICPRQDMDWYTFTLGSGDRLLSVSPQMSTAITAVELTYSIYSTRDTEKALAVSSSDSAEQIHCLDPGDYVLVLRDQGNDHEDIRHAYSLAVSGQPEPDPAEPNNGLETASAIASDSSANGYIACVGDQDWYAVEIAPGNVLAVNLSSQLSAYQPKLRLLSADGNALAERVNLASGVEATSLDIYYVPSASGKYYLVVSDDDDKEADAKVPYTLTYQAVQDNDTREPNNSPAEATALSEAIQPCGSSWSTTFEMRGTVGARGDVDWYKLPVSHCNGGVVEAELQFDTAALSAEQAWQFQEKVQSALALVRAHPSTSCKKDTDCQSLKIACDPKKEGWECEGFFNSCRSDGFCAGGSACLPQGVCGATETERHYQVASIPATVSQAPPDNKVSLSAPLFGDDTVYLRVSDYQSDGGDPSVMYTLRVKIRADPDPADRTSPPNNLYGNLLNNDNFPVEQSFSRAVSLPVHDCTAGDCCSNSTWVTGAISYQNDVDWFKYTHPCPCRDCLLRLRYQVDNGPVTHGLYLYQGESEFFAFTIAGSGSFGTNECLYAYQGHCGSCPTDGGTGGQCSTYYIAIRDYLGGGTIAQEAVGTASHWSADQPYRICLEKYSNKCESPCEVAADGTCKSP
jgi:hypothetical protein